MQSQKVIGTGKAVKFGYRFIIVGQQIERENAEQYKKRATELIAYLYWHRMESYARKVKQFASEFAESRITSVKAMLYLKEADGSLIKVTKDANGKEIKNPVELMDKQDHTYTWKNLKYLNLLLLQRVRRNMEGIQHKNLLN